MVLTALAYPAVVAAAPALPSLPSIGAALTAGMLSLGVFLGLVDPPIPNSDLSLCDLAAVEVAAGTATIYAEDVAAAAGWRWEEHHPDKGPILTKNGVFQKGTHKGFWAYMLRGATGTAAGHIGVLVLTTGATCTLVNLWEEGR